MSGGGARAARLRTARVRVLGLAFFLVLALFVWLCIAIYRQQFTTFTKVDLVTDTIGNTLPMQADVKVRGLTVGHVKSSSTTNGRVTSVLMLDPSKADKIPANVTARLLPKTLFGERYVDLVLPKDPSGRPLRTGDVIGQDASGNALELTKLFDTLLPLLQAVPPQSLAATLGSLAQALSGRGDDLGVTVDRLQSIFAQTNAVMPDLQEDIKQFATFAKTYSNAAPDLVDALNNLRTTNSTVIQKRSDVDALVASLTPTASHLADFLNANRDNVIGIAADSRETLGYLAEYSPSYVCTMRNFAIAVPKINKILGQGTDTPGSRVTVELTNPRGRYLPNQDEPRWLDTRGPWCEPVPANGVDPGQYPSGPPNDGSYQPPSRNPGPQHGLNLAPPPGLKPVSKPVYGPAAKPVAAHAHGRSAPSIAGSPMEQRALSAVYSAATGIPAKDIPSWATRIGAPALRGSEVSVR
ncbi:MAG: MCE family protein [Mycobacteriaceae bacterium]|nr:MCE family protein [Mycobacteriaceae bacterium]